MSRSILTSEQRKAARARRRAERKRLKDTYGRAHAEFGGEKGVVRLSKGYVRVGIGVLTKVSIENAVVRLEGHGSTYRSTWTRVGVGMAVAGPLGGLVGGAAQKERPGTWIVVGDRHGGLPVRVPVLDSEIPDAVDFVTRIATVQRTIGS